MSAQTHVFPQHDSKLHVLSKIETCWCAPQVIIEVSTATTHIHKPVLPVFEGHSLGFAKMELPNG